MTAARPGTQRWDPGRYARNARFVADLGMPVVELLAPKAGERILDLGCGDGALTLKLQEMGVDVVGVDASTEQIAAAVAAGVDARVLDGQGLDFEAEFDAVFSNAALHWMRENPGAVVAGVWRALKPGGRFVGEMGGGANVAAIRSAVEDALRRRGVDPVPLCPWYFPSVDEYASLLRDHGFVVRFIELFDRPTPLPSDIGGWLDTFAEGYLMALEEADRAEAKREIAAALEPRLKGDDGVWVADYVRLRFDARKPAA